MGQTRLFFIYFVFSYSTPAHLLLIVLLHLQEDDNNTKEARVGPTFKWKRSNCWNEKAGML